MDVGSTKRRRSDETTEADATAGTSNSVASNKKPIVRDKTYYRDMGDCVILVDTVLFKIHRFLLERDMSAFSNMFSLPQVNANSQINSDENPLVLYDDVDDFRALCWILYALPTDYSEQHALETANIQKLVSLYLISHKYHFEAHEKFARDLLSKHCLTLKSEPSSEYNYFNKCPETLLQAILRVAVLTTKDSHPLSSRLHGVWTNRLEQTNGPISYALGVGEALGLRDFMAELYYLELTRMKPLPIQGSLAYTHTFVDLAPHHKSALYRGSWSLRNYWSKTLHIFRKENQFACWEIPGLDGHVCREVWKECWERWDKGGTNEWEKPFDPLKEMSKIRDEIRDFNYLTSCAENLLSDMMEDLKGSLADHFFGQILE